MIYMNSGGPGTKDLAALFTVGSSGRFYVHVLFASEASRSVSRGLLLEVIQEVALILVIALDVALRRNLVECLLLAGEAFERVAVKLVIRNRIGDDNFMLVVAISFAHLVRGFVAFASCGG